MSHLLLETLHLAVPLRIAELQRVGEDLDLTHLTPERAQVLRDRARANLAYMWAQEARNPIMHIGDLLLYGGKKGEAAKVFNHLARGLAALAFAPGGVNFAGLHWCAAAHLGDCPTTPRPWGYRWAAREGTIR